MEPIQSYDTKTQTFAEPVSTKVKKLLDLKRIVRVTDGVWAALPIPGYNRTTYAIKEYMGRLMCNCQKGRKGGECSHTKAVRIFRAWTEPREQQLHLA